MISQIWLKVDQAILQMKYMSKEEREIEMSNETVGIVEKSLVFNDRTQRRWAKNFNIQSNA